MVIKSWVLNESVDSEMSVSASDSNRSSCQTSSTDYENEMPPPLPPLPPPKKPARTFLYDRYSARFSVSDGEMSGCLPVLYPSDDDDYNALVRFFGKDSSQHDEIYEEILPVKEPICIDRESSQEEGGSDWSGSAESFQLDENKNFVEDRKRYLELAKSLCNLHRNPSVIFKRPEVKPEKEDCLCDAAFLLGLTYKDSVLTPEVHLAVPDSFVIDEGLRKMCFPDASSWNPSGVAQEYYTVVLTRENGERYYVHCHRVKVEGSDTVIPYSYCVISKHRCTSLFKQLLHEVTRWHGLPMDERLSLLSHLCDIPVPPPGGSVSVKSCSFKRPVDWRKGELGLDFLFSRFDGSSGNKILVNLFSTLLLERKVILVGRSISEVSLAVQGLNNMLYPLVWAYNLVSILPSDMVRMTESPAPYIMGILTSEDLDIAPPDAGMVVNIDSGAVLFATGDEATILPKCVRSGLRTRLKAVKYRLEPGESSIIMALVSEAFLLTMVELYGHYQECLDEDDKGSFTLNRERFIQSHPVEECRPFLQWFADTEMFYNYIMEKCNPQQLLSTPSNSDKPGSPQYKPIDGPLERKYQSMVHGGNSALYVPKKNVLVKRKLEKFAGMFKDKFSGSS